MARAAITASRNWSSHQEAVVTRIFCYDIKPTGGGFDAVIGPRVNLVWQPVLDLFTSKYAVVHSGLTDIEQLNAKVNLEIGMLKRH